MKGNKKKSNSINYEKVAKDMIENEYSIREMAKILGKSKSAVYHHLVKLVNSGNTELGEYLKSRDKHSRK